MMAFLTCLLFVLFLRTGQAEHLSNETIHEHAHAVKNDVLAFSAELSSDTEVGPGGTIVFDKVITNAGSLYVNTTGQFVCPDGLYVFVWNLMKYSTPALPGMRCIGSLRSGGVDRKYGPKTSYFGTTYSGVSQMTSILECTSSPPTAITIISKPWSEEVGSTSMFNNRFNSFSGFKLQAGVAFTAELSQDQMAFPGARIMFDNVLTNYGGHYDDINGRFNCPDAGVYVFTVSTHTSNPNTPWSVSRLMMQKEVVMQGPMTYIATNDYDSGSSSTTTVLQCTPGFSIYVESQAAHDFMFNSYGANLTSFTGFKLYDLTTESVAFTVLMTQNFTSASTADPIPLDEVIINIGGAFDTSNNHFVCPDDAYYMFTWTSVSPNTNNFMSLYMDGSLVKYSYTTGKFGSDDMGTSGSCSQSVIVQCQPGSLLWAASFHDNDPFLAGYTSLSGYKLPGLSKRQIQNVANELRK